MRANLDLVSIIVPVYNVAPYLRKCINSLTAQSYMRIEIILVDDGSTDESGNICDQYIKLDERIRVIHKANGGLSDARNAGIDAATGRYIMFVDSDDYLGNRAVEYLVTTAMETGSSIVQMKSNIVSAEYTILMSQSGNSLEIESTDSQEYIKGMCEKTKSESVCDKLFESELFYNRRFEKGRLNEDFFFLAQMLLQDYKIAVIDYSGYNYYQRHGSITNSGFGKSIVDAVKNAYDLMILSESKKPALKKHFARLLLFQIRTAFITMPYAYVQSNSDNYTQMYNYLNQTKQYIWTSGLKTTDKVLLKMIVLIPKPTLFIVSRLWKMKERYK